MEPEIVEKDQMILVGFSFFGDPFSTAGEWEEENEIGRLWKRFLAYVADHADHIKHVTSCEVMYEVHIISEETALKGYIDVFVGLEVARLQDVPVELLVKVLPPTKYAVFTLQGARITSDWPIMIYRGWLPGSGYQEAHPYSFQRYDHRFKGLDRIDESALEVYVPLK